MNNNKSTKWLTGAMMSAVLASGFTACTDDHFDINSDVLGKQTIWQNIKSNSELSEYADILQSVYYSTTEEKTTPETYANLFDGDQTFTVWAPINGSFNYSYYKSLLASGNRDSIYKVEKELIRNNMTRYAHVINGTDSVKLDLFNAKSAWLNYDNQTIKSSKMTNPNIGSSNGILHVVNKPIAYQYNLYEYMATNPNLDSLNTFIKSFQKILFLESASTQGPTIEGQITWVDSITTVSNTYCNGYLGAYLEKEDSNYVMIMPTNKAWTETLEKTKKLFHYKAQYKQDVNTQTEEGVDTVISGYETNFTQPEIDSLLNLRSKDAICHALAFNANWQYEKVPITSIADIRALDARNDSLLTTSRYKFKKTGTLNKTNIDNVIEVDNYAKVFGDKDPVETSNGYAYIVDSYDLPSTVYAPNLEMNAISCLESADQACMTSYVNKSYEYTTNYYDEEGNLISQSDTIMKYSYLVLGQSSSTSNPGAFFRLRNVLSCKYDIFVVIGFNTDYSLPNKFRAYISYDTEDKRIAYTNGVLKNPNEDAVDAKDKSLYNTNYFVNKTPDLTSDEIPQYTDTICIAKDFEFPVCYYGMANAYPTIQIKSNVTNSEKSTYSREIWVDQIILRPKE